MISKEMERLEEEREKKEHWVPIPYTGSKSNQIAGMLRRKFGWKMTFTPGTKVKRMLKSLKDSEELQPPGVYEIPCMFPCTQKYYGQSGLPWDFRVGQHETHAANHDFKQSAVSRHLTNTRYSHQIDWGNSRLISKERNSMVRRVKEGIFIQHSKNPIMNQDPGFILSNEWLPIVPKLKIQTFAMYEPKGLGIFVNNYNFRTSTRPK
jgi:hypothetical protein